MTPAPPNRLARALQFLVALSVVVLVWSIGYRDGDGPGEVLPTTESQFSLDLDVIATVDHDLIYAVEQRARPYYRIFSLNPATGEVETVYTVPEDAIIHGIALSPDRSTLAVAYSPDLAFGGNGIWTIDLATGEFTERLAATSNVYLTDLAWSPDADSLLATSVDRREEDEELSAARLSLVSGELTTIAEAAVNPVQIGDDVYYLTVDRNNARRTIGVVDTADGGRELRIGDTEVDLDHLTARPEGADTLRVAVLDADDEGLTFGTPAEAHGNHDQPSTWWTVALDDDGTAASATDLEPIIVYDAVATADAIVYATGEGIAFGTSERTDVVFSRAIRFVAG